MSDFDRPELLAFARAMASMAAADGRVTDDERYELDNVLMGMRLSPSDPDVREAIDAQFRKPGPVAELVAPIRSRDLRAALMRLLVEMACSDGDIAPAEKTRVLETGAAFGFAATLVEELVGVVVDGIRLEAREQDVMRRLTA